MRFLWLLALFVSANSAFAQTDPPARESGPSTVDVALVIAADASFSVSKEDLALRREAYAKAIVSSEFIAALRAGPLGKVAVTYFEWSLATDQRVIVPWRVIDGPDAAAAVAAEIMQAPGAPHSRTSMSGAINFAASLFESDPARGARRIIDISGDGPNNSGGPVLAAREAALANGTTINGLPITFQKQPRADTDIDHLDFYYEDCVAGGPGSFVLPVTDRDNLKDAIRSMLVSEIAGRPPERANVPSSGSEKRISCLIGEEMYERAWNKPSVAPKPPAPLRGPSFTAWQLSEFAAYTKKCFARHGETIQNKVALSVTIGPDGMIIGEPQILSSSDSAPVGTDVKAAIRKLHQCQPYIVDPFAKVRAQFTQVFQFGADRPTASIATAIHENFKKCWKASRTGPTIWVKLTYKPDGTYGNRPLLMNPVEGEDYARAATRVMGQIAKCPPVKFPKGQSPNQSFDWQFPSYESARAARSKT